MKMKTNKKESEDEMKKRRNANKGTELRYSQQKVDYCNCLCFVKAGWVMGVMVMVCLFD